MSGQLQQPRPQVGPEDRPREQLAERRDRAVASARQRGPRGGRTKASCPDPGGEAQSRQGLGASEPPDSAGAALRLALMGEGWGAWAAWYLLENKTEDLVTGSVVVSQHAVLADIEKQGKATPPRPSASDPQGPSPSARTGSTAPNGLTW